MDLLMEWNGMPFLRLQFKKHSRIPIDNTLKLEANQLTD